MEVLKDVLVAAGRLESYFEMAPVNLWRAKRIRSHATLFGLAEQSVVLSNGQLRPADIHIFQRGGALWVSCRPSPRGISTFDKPGTFKGSVWEYFRIPAGTVLPSGLALVRDKFNARVNATHYTIAPARDMPLTVFKRLLDELAKVVVKEAA